MKNIERIIFYGIFIIGAVVFSIYDLPIMENMYNSSNIYGYAMSLLAELPFLWLVAFAGWTGFRYRDRRTTNINMFWGIVFLLGALIPSLYAGLNLGKDLALINTVENGSIKSNQLVYGVTIAIIVFLSSLVVAYSFKAKDKSRALSWGISVLGLWLLMIVFTLALKVLWYRPRYRYLITEDAKIAGVEFLEWWKPNCQWKYNSEFASFPSGHTIHAVGLIVLADLPSIFSNKTKNNRWGYLCVMFTWVVMTGVSRILQGAHFSTDVTFTYFLGLVLYDLVFSCYCPGLLKRNQKRLEISRCV